MIYLELFIGFLKVGLFSFGGGYAAIPLIRDTVLSYGWINDEKLSYMIAISESTPGPIMVNMATYVGSSQGGILGAIIATLAVILPAFVFIILIAKILKNFVDNIYVQGALTGLKACIVAIILAMGIYISFANMFGSISALEINVIPIVLFVILSALYFGARMLIKKKFSPIWLIVVSAIAGIIAYS